MQTAPHTFDQKRAGRPRGRQHDSQVQVRMPKPLLDSLREFADRNGLTVGQIIRSAIQHHIATMLEPLSQIAQNPDAKPKERLRAVELLRTSATASLCLGPHGLALARAKAAMENGVN